MNRSYTLTEGKCEARLIKYLKDEYDIPFGKIIKKNVVTTSVNKLISFHKAYTQSKQTWTIYLIFDCDIFTRNELNVDDVINKVKKLNKIANVSRIICLIQHCFEDEMCEIIGFKKKDLYNLFNAEGKNEFTANFINSNNTKISNMFEINTHAIYYLWTNEQKHINILKRNGILVSNFKMLSEE